MRKKLLFMGCLSVLISCSLKAQEKHYAHNAFGTEQHAHGGRIFVGGALTYWNDNKAKTQTLDLVPEIGYLFNDTWGIGTLLGYGYETERMETSNAKKNTRTLHISPFVRYYYVHRGPFDLFLDSGFGLNVKKIKMKGSDTVHTRGFEVGVRPGACIDLTEGLCLCLRMGFVGYRKDYFSGEEEGIGNQGFGIRFAPEELAIGLELEF